MGPQFIRQHEPTQEEEERIIKQLKLQIELSNTQMHHLVCNEEEFVQKIAYLNNQAKQKINKKTQLAISQALVYLAEAQKILQYAAACGKNINRQLIVSVLHNQACVYQILWQLEQCSNYLEALIFNYQSFLKQSNQFSVPPSCINVGSYINGGSIMNVGSHLSTEPQKMFGFAGGSEISYLSKIKDKSQVGKMQLKLLNYYFQHCAVSSQLQKNRKGLESAKKGIRLLRNSFLQHRSQLIEQMSSYKSQYNENPELKYFLLQQLSEMSEKINLNQSKDILKSAHFSLQIWLNNKHNQSTSQIKNSSETDTIKEKLKNLAIGTIMEIMPKQFNKVSNQAVSDNQMDSIFSIPQFMLRVFFLSVGYFSVATELRLLCNLAYKNRKEQDKKNSTQYKESMIYHLIAIVIGTIYIPFECRYIQDILASYSRHYSHNLEEYKPIQPQSIEKIIVLLGFKKQHQLIPKMGRSTKQSADLQKQQLNQYSMNYNNQLAIKHKLKNKHSLTHKQTSENLKQQDQLVKQSEKNHKQNTQRYKQNDKLKSSKNQLKISNIKKSRADSKTSKMKRSISKQSVNIKDKIQTKYNELQKILSADNLASYDQGPKSPLKKLKTTQKQKTQHHQKQKINTKKNTDKQKQREQLKVKIKTQGKKIKVQKTQRKTKNLQKKEQQKTQKLQKTPKGNTVTEQDQQFFFYMTKKTTKTNQNGNMFSPKQSIKSIGSSRRSTGKKSSMISSRSNSKNSPRMVGNIQSPSGMIQSPNSKGFLNIKKMNGEKKSPRLVVSGNLTGSRNYF